MDQSFIVYCFFLPTDENPPKTIHPGGDALYHPAASAAASDAFGDLFFATGFDVRNVTASAGFAVDDRGIVSLIAAEMLRTTRCGVGTTDGKTAKRGVKKFLIMHISAGDRNAQRYAPAIGQHRAFDTQLASIRRVFPGFFGL